MKKFSTLMLAYGANTNLAHMSRRCPSSVYLGNAVVRNYKLVFRTVADVIEAKGHKLHVAVWAVTPEDEASLDRFESVPYMYVKRYISLKFPDGTRRKALCYMMRGPRSDRMEPPQGYEDTLREGYANCGMPIAQIDAAIADAVESHRRERVTKTSWDRPAIETAPTVDDTTDDEPTQEEREADIHASHESRKQRRKNRKLARMMTVNK